MGGDEANEEFSVDILSMRDLWDIQETFQRILEI